MGLNHHFSFGALRSRKNEGDHGFKPGLLLLLLLLLQNAGILGQN